MAKKLYTGNLITKLAQALISGNPNEKVAAAYKTFGRNNINNIKYADNGDPLSFNLTNPNKFLKEGVTLSKGQPITRDLLSDKTLEDYATNQANINEMYDTSNGVSLGQLGTLAKGAISEHPFKAAGLGALGLGNLGGLMDGNGIGGQLVGMGLGGLADATIGSGLSPYWKAMAVLGGGQLGSLFDKLRAKKEQEAQQMQQMQQYRR